MAEPKYEVIITNVGEDFIEIDVRNLKIGAAIWGIQLTYVVSYWSK